MPHREIARRFVAEALGTALLLVAIVGSGIMAQRLSPDDAGLRLLENSTATGAALVALILIFGSVSGAHFNPVVTIVARVHGSIRNNEAAVHVVAQLVGACTGTILANVMFDLPAVEWSTQERSSGPLALSEIVATAGLLLVISGCVRTGRATSVPYAVGAWIASAYWFTSSTSFANPAVTIGRTLSDSFAGIAPSSVPMFVAMQLVGTVIAIALIAVLYPRPNPEVEHA
jgi:glycerol uptake facilitator-like aquaporin